jgi:hypothetical protein
LNTAQKRRKVLMAKKQTKTEGTELDLGNASPEEVEIQKIREEANQKIRAIKEQRRSAKVPQQIQAALEALTRLAADPMNVTAVSLMVRTADVRIHRDVGVSLA